MNEDATPKPEELMPKQYNQKSSEDKWKNFWETEGIFAFTYDASKPLYVVDTPPPYVSADHLHAGHIKSYAEAEYIVRFKRMRGYNVFYPMGFDDNGLPTERFVEKKYNIEDKSKITKSEFIKLCLQETENGAKTYKKLWNDLGISVDWSKTYSSISPLAQKVSQLSLIDLYEKGHLYRNESPILWCTTCQTAIAQADLEDKEENSQMNYINFHAKDGVALMIATTRPELLPACVALYVNPTDSRFKDLVGTEARVPLFNYSVPIKTSEKVDKEVGTGLMMVCTWGDSEDLEKWHNDKLETRALINPDGKLSALGGEFEGMYLLKARKQILAKLQESGDLVKQEDITHTKNVHERCGTATDFVLSKQWFIKIADLKDTWLEQGKKIKWYPLEKRQIYDSWVSSLKWDWCISRQRYYGVPLPIWYCASCSEPIFARKEDLPVNPLETKAPVSECPKCSGTEIIAESDVMDTWATSSCTPFLIRELVGSSDEAYSKLFPVSLRPNAFEIIRTWDFYSIVKAYYNFGSIPFNDVMVSGHGLDEQGRKISKRLGNYTPADELVAQYGADPIRYWATGANLGQNLRFNPSEIEKGKKTVNKLWNVARFLTMYMKEFNMPVAEYAFEPADLWILKSLGATVEKVTAFFETYEYGKARDAIDTLFWSQFADYYIEFVKYRLNGDADESSDAAKFTLQTVLRTILKMYAPILPFVTEEIYSLLFNVSGSLEKSIHVSSWPLAFEVSSSLDVSDFDSAISAIDEIRKHKTSQNISLGAVLEEYTLTTKVNLEKYGEFIKAAIRVKGLK